MQNGKEKLEYFLSLFDKKIQDNVTIVTPEILKTKHLIHISKNNDVTEFIPNISKKTLINEDRTLPRICTTKTIWGSLIGYSLDLTEFFDLNSVYQKTNDFNYSFLGGYSIYGLEFDYALKPNKNILPDCSKTNEMWIVNHDPDKKQIPFKKIGNVFYSSINYKKHENKLIVDLNLFLEITNIDSVYFNEHIVLKAGCYSIKLTNITWNGYDYERNSRKGEFGITEISKELFEKEKKNSASMLSYGVKNPSYVNW